MGKSNKKLRVIPLGGLNEIGKNITAIEYGNDIMLIDCGMSFPDDEMFGIDVVIPDFSYLVKNAEKVRGLVITHGHEDHIGAVPYLLQKLNVPIFGTRLPLGLIKNKCDEHGIKPKLKNIKAGDKFNLGVFKVEAIRTTHSIADAICIAINTPVGKIFHTGDFKIDYTPVDGDPIDLAKLAQLGSEGVLLMMSDSTNATRSGFTESEMKVGNALETIMRSAKNRIIISTFSSNVHRIQKIVDNAVKFRRNVAFSGRSMENVVSLATELGYLSIPKGTLVDINQTASIPDKKLVIITTGSQGEPMSALARMANSEHRSIEIKKGDTVILSSSPVPGNEKMVSNVVNKLIEKGANVIYSDIADTHVSGHACAEELKLMHSLIRPKYFMPVHGEYRHLKAGADIGEQIGTKRKNIFILSNGDALEIDKKNATVVKEHTTAGSVLVDGLGIGDVGNIVLRDRKVLSESGLLIVVATVDRKSSKILSGPSVISRGFVYMKESESFISETTVIARKAIEQNLSKNVEWNTIKVAVRDDLRKFIYSRTKRNPLILPIFMEV
ncbi:MAG: ribonuclease J [Eubacteriales bacterium]|nr:ribonuclease J [Eubacteriales bacterium]MDY3332810.1 ribonuclease J [Gallibacter sp.]